MPGISSKTDVLAIRIPKVLSARIDTLAKRAGVTPKEYVVTALIRYTGLLPDGGVRSHSKKGVEL